MRYEPFSPKQRQAMLWWREGETAGYEGIICDGAVRSGKTVAAGIGFLLWSMANFDGGVFAICGKSVEAVRRNVTNLMPKWMEGLMSFRENLTEHCITVRCGGKSNRYYLFGGDNEMSATRIQGITLCGVLMDEAVLMPRSFVEQAAARCSVEGSRLFITCNPGSENHWFYREWIQKAGEKNLLYLHMTMEDNPGLSAEIRRRYENLYSGVFYRRYIQGLWVQAEGLVYEFDRETMVTEELPRGRLSYYISVDYGTRNPCSMGLWVVNGRGQALRLKEYYYDSRKTMRQLTDEEYYRELRNLAGRRRIEAVVVDPSALSFITVIRRHGRFSVRKARNDVITGIRLVAGMLKQGRIRIHPDCADAMREFSLYRWAEDGTERPVKEDDHAMDEIRYFAATVLDRM